MKRILGGLAAIMLIAILVGPALAKADKVYVCHAAGQAGTTNFVTLYVPANDGGFPNGHFTESGTAESGHEDDYLGECLPEVTPSPSLTVTPSPTATAPTITPTPQPSVDPTPTASQPVPSSTPTPSPSSTPTGTPTSTSPPSPIVELPETDTQFVSDEAALLVFVGFLLLGAGLTLRLSRR